MEDKEHILDSPGLPSLPEVQIPSSVGQQLVKLPFSSSSTFTAYHQQRWWNSDRGGCGGYGVGGDDHLSGQRERGGGGGRGGWGCAGKTPNLED